MTVPLSPREKQICALVSKGRSNKKIAASLKLAASTVKKHLSTIFLKTSCHSRTELAVHYIQGAPAKTVRANSNNKPRL
jgi:DNA-binding NarL/FixJ family response regulator